MAETTHFERRVERAAAHKKLPAAAWIFIAMLVGIAVDRKSVV